MFDLTQILIEFLLFTYSCLVFTISLYSFSGSVSFSRQISNHPLKAGWVCENLPRLPTFCYDTFILDCYSFFELDLGLLLSFAWWNALMAPPLLHSWVTLFTISLFCLFKCSPIRFFVRKLSGTDGYCLSALASIYLMCVLYSIRHCMLKSRSSFRRFSISSAVNLTLSASLTFSCALFFVTISYSAVKQLSFIDLNTCSWLNMSTLFFRKCSWRSPSEELDTNEFGKSFSFRFSEAMASLALGERKTCNSLAFLIRNYSRAWDCRSCRWAPKGEQVSFCTYSDTLDAVLMGS